MNATVLSERELNNGYIWVRHCKVNHNENSDDSNIKFKVFSWGMIGFALDWLEDG